jgi:hypothetical protein
MTALALLLCSTRSPSSSRTSATVPPIDGDDLIAGTIQHPGQPLAHAAYGPGGRADSRAWLGSTTSGELWAVTRRTLTGADEEQQRPPGSLHLRLAGVQPLVA